MKLSLALWTSVLGGNIFEDDDFHSADRYFVDHDTWNNSEGVRIHCGEKRDEKLANVRWFMAVGSGNAVEDFLHYDPATGTEDRKIIDSNVNPDHGLKIEDDDLIGDTSLITFDKETGDLIIPGTYKFDTFADGEDGFRQQLLFGFKCDADYGVDGKLNYGPVFKQLLFLDVPAEEDMIKIEKRYQDGFEFGDENKEEEIAECSTGYANREPDIKWFAYNEDGTEFREIVQDKNWSKRIIDTHVNGNQKVDLTLQFGGQVGTLGAEFDKKYFVCETGYKHAENGAEADVVRTQRYPKKELIRIEHDISKMDFVVNGNIVGDVDELIVSADEETVVSCDADGYERGVGEPQETYTVNGKKTKGPITQKFAGEVTIECEASTSKSSKARSVNIVPKTIDIQSAMLDQTYRPDIDDQLLTIALGTDVDFDKLDVSILDSDGNKIDIGEPEVRENGVDENGVPQYVLVYKVPPEHIGEADKIQVGIKDNGGIQKTQDIINDKSERTALSSSDEEHVVCHFQQYGDIDASRIKFWYNECSDENPGILEKITSGGDHGSWKGTTEAGTVKSTIDDPVGGVYICCYDYNNDVSPSSQSGLSSMSCSAESANNFLFSGKNKFCKATYIEPSSGFPWWIILVLFLIILIVVAAIMWWRKKKNDEEADLEAGNVDKPQQIPDGQIDATQEFEGGQDSQEDENLLKDGEQRSD